MRTVCLVLLTALGSGFRSQASLHTENAALRHQLAVLQRQAVGARGYGPVTGCSGRGSLACGPAGDTPSSSSSPTPCSGGIDTAFGSTGVGKVGLVDPAGPVSHAPSKRSSARCATPTRPGAPHAFTASCSSSASRSRKPRSENTWYAVGPAVPDLAYLPDESCPPTRRGRFLCGPDIHISCAVRVRRAGP